MSLTIRDANSLLATQRIDVLSKVDYAFERLHGLNLSWGALLYSSYLHATRPSGDFDENGDKTGISDYFSQFDDLIQSLKADGFDSSKSSIPLSGGWIENGAHRLAACLVMGHQVAVHESLGQPQVYDWKFLTKIGLPEIFLDKIGLNFVRASSDVLGLLITGMDDQESRSIVDFAQANSDVVLAKRISLTEIGKRRLMALAYDQNDWWQEKFLETMAQERFRSGDDYAYATAIFYRQDDVSNPRVLKELVRTSLSKGVFERQIHGTDNHLEALYLAEVFLNVNGRDFLNSAPLGAEKNIELLVRDTGLKPDGTWAVDGSTTLAMYGIRDARDLDIVISSCSQQLSIKNRKFDRHEAEYSKYPLDFESVIFDPRLHFQWKGVKYMSLGALSHTKMFSNDDKAIRDQKLILEFLGNQRPLYFSRPKAAPVLIWKIQSMAARKLEPLLSGLPAAIEKPIRRSLKALRIGIERLFRV